MKRSFVIALLLTALGFFSGAAAAQDAFTNRATELKSAPSPDAATVAPVAQETSVKVIGRQSGWTQIQAGDKSGWVRAFHLRYQSTVTESREGSTGGGLLGGLFGGSRRQAPKGTSTVGIRGLSTEELQGAAPNPEALAKLQGLRSDTPTAQRFAADGKLLAVKIDYVESEPEPPRKGARR